MDMIQQLFMVAFFAFIFSILVEKLAFVTIKGEEWKSKKSKYNNTKSKSKCKNQKKVQFAVYDQIAIVINNKLVKLGAIKRLPTKKQVFRPTSYDFIEVHFGANWIGEELMMYKELGLCMKPCELGFGGIQHQRETLIVEDQKFAIDDNDDEQTKQCKE